MKTEYVTKERYDSDIKLIVLTMFAIFFVMILFYHNLTVQPQLDELERKIYFLDDMKASIFDLEEQEQPQEQETFEIIENNNWLLHVQINNLDDSNLKRLIELRAEELKADNQDKTVIRVTGCSVDRCLTYEVSQDDLKAGVWL